MAELTPEQRKWIVLYPVYIQKGKTIQEGRRIPIDHCVENPTVVDISKVASFSPSLRCTGLRSHEYQARGRGGSAHILMCSLVKNKAYPRDYMLRFADGGRVRVQMKDAAGAVLNESLNSRCGKLMGR